MQRHHLRISVTLAALALSGLLPALGAAPAPTITGYASPNAAGVPITSASPGAALLILGTNFGTTTGTVDFAGIPAPAAASWSPTAIVAIVPATAAYPLMGPVTVTANGQTASGPAFTITAPPPALRPGDLDPSFGGGGKVLTDFGGSGAGANGMTVQPDGRIVVAGYVNGPFALARYNVDGSLDSSFGTGGKVLTGFGGSQAGAIAVALQPDGRILAAGYSYGNGKQHLALARYNVDGSLDSSFGAGGKVLTDFSGSGAVAANALAVQPDGQIVAAGVSSLTNGKYGFALARYNGNGSLDSAFGTGGKVLTDFGGSALANAMAVQPDGRIVVAGDGKSDFVLARYNVNGSLDASFGTGGKVLTDFGGLGAFALAVSLQPDGEIVAAGGSFLTKVKTQFALARYNGDGSLDSSFGTGGEVLTDFGASAGANAMAVQPDGQIVAAGDFTAANGKVYAALARYQGR